MRDYLKPSIEDEEIEIEDVINASGGNGLTLNGTPYNPNGTNPEDEYFQN